MTAGSGRLVERFRQLEARPESARLARQEVLEALEEAGRTDLTDVASLLVSELVTNAIVHARTTIHLAVLAGPDGVRVSVHDTNPNQPTHRHYSPAATTGRGLELLELMSDRHGIAAGESGGDSATEGKSVWFELGTGLQPADQETRSDIPYPDTGTQLTVELRGLPVRLARAWQQHADALLRELLLSCWDDDEPRGEPLPADEAAATDAFSLVAAALEALGDAGDLPAYVDLPVPLRRPSVARFEDLDILLDHVARLAETGHTLAPPTLPEIRLLRTWICEQVREQADGEPARPWPGVPLDPAPTDRVPVDWDPTAVRTSSDAVVAGDDANRIIEASPSALELLGWDEDLIGQRLVAVIPHRFRDDHVASFTMQLLTGETTILGREISVPALRRDGTEVPVQLLVRRESAAGGRAVFTARLTRQ